MPRIALNQGAYTSRSVISSAQRAVNIYPEKNPPDAQVELTHYNAPGLTALNSPLGSAGRGLYWANSDRLFYAVGNTIYLVSSTWGLQAIGQISTTVGRVSMADNGTTMLIGDGSGASYQVNLSSLAFSQITAGNNSPPSGSGSVYGFYGFDRVDAIDGYLVMNQPGTQNFYSTYENEIVFDALYFAEKNGYSDLLVTVIVARRQIWLIGERTTEIWYDAGATPGLPFAIIPGPFIHHGCSAKHSVAQIDGAVFWLSQDQAGNTIMARGDGGMAERISTHAIEQEWQSYSEVSDATGFTFQVGGHSFYQINFPNADKSWRWDETTRLWHEVAWTDGDGQNHRHRVDCVANAYGIVVGADWQTGQLYKIDPDAYTDAGAPMFWRRGFPHSMSDGKRVIYPGFTLDIEAATTASTTPAQVLLRWSDDRGRSWSEPLSQSVGAVGQYLTQPKWSRLGLARDRVWEVFGVVPGRLAINGAFLDPAPMPLAS